MQSLVDPEPESSFVLDLDGDGGATTKAQRSLRLFRSQIPRLRVAGMVFLAALVLLHRALLPERAQGAFAPFALLVLAHLAWTTAAVRLARTVRAVERHGQVALGLDLVVVLGAIVVTGGPRSLLFWVPIVRVADQAFMGVRWCLWFTHAAVLGLALAFWANHAIGGEALPWTLYGLQIGLLWCAGIYLSSASFQSERARRRTSRAMRVARDLIARLELQSEDLLDSNLQIEAATRAKTVFLASMSHELRTPMNAILGMTHLTLEGDLAPAQREQLELVHRSAEGLLEILNDILELSRLEAGKVELAPTETSPQELVAGPVKTLALLAHEKDLDVLCEVDPELPARVCVDAGRVRQVVTNLLGNAIKFTADGHVAVRLGRTPDGSALACEVVDTGKGIEPDRLERIFEAFTQEHERISGEHGGTGLGLTISHQLVRRLGGELGVESRPGEGSRFWFTLPLEGATGRLVERGLEDATRVEYRLAQPTLEASLRRTVARLRAVGPDAGTPAEDAAGTVTVLLADGLEALGADELQRVANGDGLRLVLLPRRTAPLSAQPLGAVSIVQPPMLDELLKALRGEREDELDRRRGDYSEEGDPRGLRLLVAEDNLVNQRVIGSYLVRMGHTATFAADGLEAVELAARQGFDGILMDVQMPRLDGIEATRRICARGAARPWIVALTAGVLPSDRDKCFEAGMDGFLEKPVRPDELRRVLRERTEANAPDSRAA